MSDRFRLYITRHGKAEPESETGRDEDRPLRRKGERQAEFLVSHLLGADRHPTLILTSRLRRAIETSRILGEGLGCPVREEATLGLGHPVSEVVEVLDLLVRQSERDVMLVGHNPQVEMLVSVLSGGPSPQPGMPRMRTGECAILEFKGTEVVGGARLLDMVRLVAVD